MRDAQQPGADAAFARLEARGALPQAHKHLLRHLLRRALIAGHAGAEAIHSTLVVVIDCGERLDISVGDERQKLGVFEVLSSQSTFPCIK
jgi:hypothetical protein